MSTTHIEPSVRPKSRPNLRKISTFLQVWASALQVRWLSIRADSPRTLCTLPFAHNSELRSYNYQAYPVGIIGATGPLSVHILQYHIQLFFPTCKVINPTKNIHVRFLPGVGINQFKGLGCIETQCHDSVALESMRVGGLLKFVTRAIGNGRYLYVHLNHYFIPTSTLFGKRHERTTALIHGFNLKNGTALVAMYTNGGDFIDVHVPFSLLWQSVRLGRYNIAPGLRWEWATEIWRLDTGRHSIEKAIVYKQLSDYVEGVANLKKYDCRGEFALPNNSWPMPIADPVGGYGIGIYAHLIAYLRAAARNNARIDLRTTRTIMEHKMMLLRLLGPNGLDVRIPGIASNYGEIAVLAKKLHLIAFAADKDRQCIPVDEMSAIVKRITEQESIVLRAVVEANPR